MQAMATGKGSFATGCITGQKKKPQGASLSLNVSRRLTSTGSLSLSHSRSHTDSIRLTAVLMPHSHRLDVSLSHCLTVSLPHTRQHQTDGGVPGEFEFEVPYVPYGTEGGSVLKGDALMTQVDKWVRQGVIELDCGHAIQHVVRTKEWLDLSDRCHSPTAGYPL